MANIECTMYACPAQANQVLTRALRGLDLLLYRRHRPHRWPVAVDVVPRQGGRGERGLATGPLAESLPLLVPLASQCTPLQVTVDSETPLALALALAIAIHRHIHAAQHSAGHPL